MESPHRLLSKTEIREALGNWVGLEDTRHTAPSAGGLTLLHVSAMRTIQIDHLGGAEACGNTSELPQSAGRGLLSTSSSQMEP